MRFSRVAPHHASGPCRPNGVSPTVFVHRGSTIISCALPATGVSAWYSWGKFLSLSVDGQIEWGSPPTAAEANWDPDCPSVMTIAKSVSLGRRIFFPGSGRRPSKARAPDPLHVKLASRRAMRHERAS